MSLLPARSPTSGQHRAAQATDKRQFVCITITAKSVTSQQERPRKTPTDAHGASCIIYILCVFMFLHFKKLRGLYVAARTTPQHPAGGQAPGGRDSSRAPDHAQSAPRTCPPHTTLFPPQYSFPRLRIRNAGRTPPERRAGGTGAREVGDRAGAPAWGQPHGALRTAQATGSHSG